MLNKKLVQENISRQSEAFKQFKAEATDGGNIQMWKPGNMVISGDFHVDSWDNSVVSYGCIMRYKRIIWVNYNDLTVLPKPEIIVRIRGIIPK